jgi:hypothetical protein
VTAPLGGRLLTNLFGRKGTGARILRRQIIDDTFGGENDQYIEVKAKWMCRITPPAGDFTRDPQGIWHPTEHTVIGNLTGLSPELSVDDRLEQIHRVNGEDIVDLYEVKSVRFPKRGNWSQDNAVYVQAKLERLQPKRRVTTT